MLCECKGAVDVHATVTDHGDGTYLIVWRAPQAGTYEAHVKLGEAHVIGSPFTLVMESQGLHKASPAPGTTPGPATLVTKYGKKLTVPQDPVKHTRRRLSMGLSGMSLGDAANSLPFSQ